MLGPEPTPPRPGGARTRQGVFLVLAVAKILLFILQTFCLSLGRRGGPLLCLRTQNPLLLTPQGGACWQHPNINNSPLLFSAHALRS